MKKRKSQGLALRSSWRLFCSWGYFAFLEETDPRPSQPKKPYEGVTYQRVVKYFQAR
ncbi:MAG: hypothetical protein U0X92_10705 [Anaerolineales bacterium]